MNNKVLFYTTSIKYYLKSLKILFNQEINHMISKLGWILRTHCLYDNKSTRCVVSCRRRLHKYIQGNPPQLVTKKIQDDPGKMLHIEYLRIMYRVQVNLSIFYFNF